MSNQNEDYGYEIVEEEDCDCGCDGGCDSCGGSCDSCGGGCGGQEDLKAAPHQLSRIRKVIGVVSGKGGVGKSLVTSMSAVLMKRRGYEVGILDADMTGPSIPMSFGVHSRAQANALGILPTKTGGGIKIMSLNLFLDDETDPVVWRGTIVGNTVKQFWTDVIWEDVDYMFVDMPPGTGDVPLTIFQSLPVDGIIVVTTPQDLVSMIVAKAVKMAQMMDVPILGLVENMSWFKCHACGEKHYIYGESRLEQTAEKYGLPILARLPIRQEVAACVDQGHIEDVDFDEMEDVADYLEKNLPVEKNG